MTKTEIQYYKEGLKLKQTRLQLHREKYTKYRMGIWVLDILIILCVLSNYGAILLTNIMVGQEGYTEAHQRVVEDSQKGLNTTVDDYMVFYETNKIQADLNNYKQAKTEGDKQEASVAFMTFIINGLFWIFFIICYLILRLGFYKDWQFYFLLFIFIYVFVLTSSDFINNYGLWIAKQLFS